MGRGDDFSRNELLEQIYGAEEPAKEPKAHNDPPDEQAQRDPADRL